MPFKSDAQRRWAHTPQGEKALGGPGKVAEWDQSSKGLQLPEKIKRRPTGAGPHKYGSGETRVK